MVNLDELLPDRREDGLAKLFRNARLRFGRAALPKAYLNRFWDACRLVSAASFAILYQNR